MKTVTIMRKFKAYGLVFLVMFSLTSCMSTKVIGSHHPDELPNEECQKVSHWKYFWGLGGSDEIIVVSDSEETECPCFNDALASVEVKSSFGDFLLTLVTLGTVNHRTVIYECAETDDGEQ